MSNSGNRGDKYVYHVDQAYDNRAYSAAGTGSHHSKHSGSRYVEDPHYQEAGYRDRESRKEQTNKKCYVFIAVFAFILLIAAAVAVGVYFGVKSDDDDDDKKTAAATVPMDITLDELWNEDLSDPSSQAYTDKANEVADGIDTAMAGTDGYMNSGVNGFSEGSIGVTLDLFFDKKEIDKGDGTTQALSDKTGTATFVKDKLQKQKDKNNAFAKKVKIEMTKVEYLEGEKGKADLGEACTADTDCQDKNVKCTSNLCTCATGYYNSNPKNTGGSCLQTKPYGAVCKINRGCGSYASGMCVNDKCDCDSTKYPKNNACVDKIDIDQPCTESEQCKYPYAVCEGGMCKCSGEYFKATGRCMHMIDIDESGCSSDDQCKGTDTKCVSNYCRCPTGKMASRGYCIDKVMLCEPNNIHLVLEGLCPDAWLKFKETGLTDDLMLLLACMGFHGVVQDMVCDISVVLNHLKAKYEEHAYEISACVNSFEYDNMKFDVVTSKDSNTVKLELLVPNADVKTSTYVAVGISKTQSMTESYIISAEYIAPGDESKFKTKIRLAGSTKTIPAVIEEDALTDFRKPRKASLDHGLSLVLRMEKHFDDQGNGFTGSGTYLLMAYGNMNGENISKHTKKALSAAKNLDCDKTELQRLNEVVAGLQTKAGLCTSTWTMRYLLKYKCIKPSNAYNDEQKCMKQGVKVAMSKYFLQFVNHIAIEFECIKPSNAYSDEQKCNVRASARMCVLKYLTNVGLSCTEQQVADTMKDSFVTKGLMDNYPPITCEAELQLTDCEKYWLRDAAEMFECQESMMIAVALKDWDWDFSALTSPDRSSFTCSLWKEMFQCYEPWLTKTKCSPASVARVASMGLKAAQTFFKNFLPATSNMFSSNLPGKTVIDYAANCPVDDLVVTGGACPTDKVIANKVLMRCGITAGYIKKYYGEGFDMCLAYKPDECGMEGMMDALKHYDGCGKAEEQKERLHNILSKYSTWFSDKLGVPDDCTARAECFKVTTEQCAAYAGLLMIESVDAKGNQPGWTTDQACGSYKLVVEELLPGCYDYHNRSECKAYTANAWKSLIQFMRMENDKLTAKFDNCAAASPEICNALGYRQVFRCVDKIKTNGPCKAASCINDLEGIESGCQYVKATLVADVKSKFQEIYHVVPECPYGACGQQTYPYFKEYACKPAYGIWDLHVAQTECGAWEAFLGCSAFNLLAVGADYCGFETLQANFKTQAEAAGGVVGSICPGHTYAELDSLFVANTDSPSKMDLCESVYTYRSIFQFFCRPPSYMFTSNSAKDNCMAEVFQKVCIYGIFDGAEIPCNSDLVWSMSNSPAVSTDIFNHNGCESNYECAAMALVMEEKLRVCTTGVVSFMSMAYYKHASGIDIETLEASSGSQEKLKCKVWNMMMGCVLGTMKMNGMPDTCWASDKIANIKDALMILIGTATDKITDFPVDVGMFKDCPAFEIPPACPEPMTLLQSFTGFCGIEGMKKKYGDDPASSEEICDAMGPCAELVIEAYRPGCRDMGEDIDKRMKALEGDMYQKEVHKVFGVYCTDCGKAMFPDLIIGGCKGQFKAWKDDTTSNKCTKFQDFVACAHVHYMGHGKSICEFDLFVKNLQDKAVEAGNPRPELCTGSTLASDLPANKAAICTSTLVYNNIFTYNCKAHFSTNTPEDECMSEISRVFCLGAIFTSFKIECEASIITSTKNMPAARAGVFTISPACEGTYKCIVEMANKLADPAAKAAIETCAGGLRDFMYMDSYFIDVYNMPAITPDSGKLKCKALDLTTACGLAYSSDECKAKPADVTRGMLLVVDMYTGWNPGAMKKTDVFQDCPAYDPTLDTCAIGNNQAYSSIVYCALLAVKVHQSIPQPPDSCGTFTGCVPLVLDGYKNNCPDWTDSDVETATDGVLQQVDYFKTLTKIDCNDAPVWAACGDGMFDLAYSVVGEPFDKWKSSTEVESLKCEHWEAFVMSVVFQYLAHWANYCSLDELAANLKAGAQSAGHGSPELCVLSDLATKLITRDNVCREAYAYNIIFGNFCPKSDKYFTGSAADQVCMSEGFQVSCIMEIFESAGFECALDVVLATKNLPEARRGGVLASPTSACEASFPCIFAYPEKAYSGDPAAAACANGINQFLYLSAFGIDINNMPAKGSPDKKLKCKVLDAMTDCALGSTLECIGDIASIRKGLLYTANIESSDSEYEHDNINIFNDCPAYESLDGCTAGDAQMYSSIAHCAFDAVKTYRQKIMEDVEEAACEQFIICADVVIKGYKAACGAGFVYEDSLMNIGSWDSRNYFSMMTDIVCSELDKKDMDD